MGKIIWLHSPRRGTGLSTVSANLAAQAALLGYRVGVVDANMYWPGLAHLYDVKTHSHRTLVDYLCGKCSVSDTVIRLVGSNKGRPERKLLVGKNLWLVAGEQKFLRSLPEGYDPLLLNKGLYSLLTELTLDYLLIDAGSGVGAASVVAYGIADALVIVLRPDLQDLRHMMVLMQGKSHLPPASVLINMATERDASDRLGEQLGAAYHLPVAGVLPFVEDLPAYGDAAGLFSLNQPDHPWSQRVRGVASFVLKP